MSSLSYDVLRVYIKNVFNIISRFFKVHITNIDKFSSFLGSNLCTQNDRRRPVEIIVKDLTKNTCLDLSNPCYFLAIQTYRYFLT